MTIKKPKNIWKDLREINSENEKYKWNEKGMK